MQLNNSFTVPVPIDEAWAALMNVEEVAGCIPGATLDSTGGDEFTGHVKVKMGPIQLTYHGKGRFVERADSDHRAVIEASGKETKGAGVVRAQTTASLRQGDGCTEVKVVTELTVTGKAAQFGRGVMEDISAKLFDQFARALAEQLTIKQPTNLADGFSINLARAPQHLEPVRPTPDSAEVLDLFSIAGVPIFRRLAVPGLIAAALIAFALYMALR